MCFPIAMRDFMSLWAIIGLCAVSYMSSRQIFYEEVLRVAVLLESWRCAIGVWPVKRSASRSPVARLWSEIVPRQISRSSSDNAQSILIVTVQSAKIRLRTGHFNEERKVWSCRIPSFVAWCSCELRSFRTKLRPRKFRQTWKVWKVKNLRKRLPGLRSHPSNSG